MKLAVIFPGIGYHCDKPLLYYACNQLKECGYDAIIKLDYKYEDRNIRGNKEKMVSVFKDLYKQAEKALLDVNFDNYDEIVFVSKSIGTIISCAYAAKKDIKCKQILYTPLEYTFEYPIQEAIAFIGTNDPWSNVNDVCFLAKNQCVKIFTYEGTNHSLETTNTLDNIKNLEQVMMETALFLNKDRIIC